jgi:predicted secreted Zn-dependent protease
MHNTKTYAVINLTDVGLIDFSQVGETSPSTIRKSLDNTQFVIKWRNGYTPTFITDGSVVPVETYDHRSILELMSTDKWSQPIEEIE